MVPKERMNWESVTNTTQTNVKIIIKMAPQKMDAGKEISATTGMQPISVEILFIIMCAQG